MMARIEVSRQASPLRAGNSCAAASSVCPTATPKTLVVGARGPAPLRAAGPAEEQRTASRRDHDARLAHGGNRGGVRAGESREHEGVRAHHADPREERSRS